MDCSRNDEAVADNEAFLQRLSEELRDLSSWLKNTENGHFTILTVKSQDMYTGLMISKDKPDEVSVSGIGGAGSCVPIEEFIKSPEFSEVC